MGEIRRLGAGRFIELVTDGGWEYARRLSTTGIVGLIAVTDDEELVLIEQYRPPVRARVIEIPAGLAGDIPGEELEPLENAARRELEEETGFSAAHLQRVWRGPVSAGMSNEILDVFRASGLTRVGAGGGDAHEEIEVHLVPLNDVHAFLRAAEERGAMIDAKVWLALLHTGVAP